MSKAERREREKQHRINSIMDAALEVFAEKGLKNATMDDVAAKAELAKGTVYLYFKSKEHLFFAIDQKAGLMLKERFIAAYESGKLGRDKVKNIGRAYYKFCFDYPNYFKAMSYVQKLEPETFKKIADEMSPKGAAGMNESSLSILAIAIEDGHKDGSISEDMHPWMTSILLWSISNGVISMIKNRGEFLKMFDLPVEQLYSLKETLVERGLNDKDE